MADKAFFKNPHCVMCPNEIPAERLRVKGNTCSQECKDELDKRKREKLQDAKECRYCRRPSTPLQRAGYARFRQLEKHAPHLVYPAKFAEWVADQETMAQANKDPKNKFPVTPEAFAKYWKTQEAAA